MKKTYASALILLCSLVMVGCDTFRDTLGLTHRSPNEWNTNEPNPTLILPPNFEQRPKLPPPTPGAPNPHAVSETERAQKAVLGSKQPAETSSIPASKSERAIVDKASEDQSITPNIREKLDEEFQTDSSVSNRLIEKIKTWKKTAANNLSLSKTEEEKADEKTDEDADSSDENYSNTNDKESIP
ncbi:MAG: DUF3035 domain-containing protein [Alphaproteobacteria bacterium]|nr:DUF3035 domain-containing protein [Alphaproteobacteria bacterium]